MKKSTAIALLVIAVVVLLLLFGYSLVCLVSELLEDMRPLTMDFWSE